MDEMLNSQSDNWEVADFRNKQRLLELIYVFAYYVLTFNFKLLIFILEVNSVYCKQNTTINICLL